MSDVFALWHQAFQTASVVLIPKGTQPIAPNGTQPTAETNGAQPTVETHCSQLTVETTPPGKKSAGECLSEDTPNKGYGQPSKLNRKAYLAAWEAANREKRREQKLNWRISNAEKFRDYQAAYRAANREKRCEQKRNWRIANRERFLQTNRDYYKADPEYVRNYRRANRERILERKREYNRKYSRVNRECKRLLMDVAAAARARGITPSASEQQCLEDFDESDGSANAAPSQVWPTHQTDLMRLLWPSKHIK